MNTPSSILPPATPTAIRPLWALNLGTRPRSLSLARETQGLLVRDENHWLYLLDRAGGRQAQRKMPTALAAACAADDGSAYAAAGARGEVWWLAPDLTTRWETALDQPAVAAALDPFGQYLAVADARSQLHCYDRQGRSILRVPTTRPLHHLAFVPAAPFLLGAADYGLVTCFDLTGRCHWRDGLVAHIGSLAVSGEGDMVLLACFTEGLQRYTAGGANKGRLPVTDPCRLAAVSYDGGRILVAGLSERLDLLDRAGRSMAQGTLELPPVGLALSPQGEAGAAALADGRVVGLALPDLPPS
jgi:hypothetical protein